ncbi:MAG: APC family permease [Caulobacterales bacterium]|nr:APC family permease [Caulobacterales bacterium]
MQTLRTLHRTLGPLEIVFLVFSALSPAMSVFIYGDGVLRMAGTGAVAAVMIGGLIAAVAAYLYAELGAAFPKAGGVYPSLVGVLGPFWTFPYITMMMVAAPTVTGFGVLGFADYVRVLFPALPQLPVALGCLALACGVAVLRVRTGAVITGLFLLLEVVALALLTAIALSHPSRSLLGALAHPVWLDHAVARPLPVATLGLAVVSAIFTCSGAHWALYFGEELTDAPRRIGSLVTWIGRLAAVVIAVPLILVVLSTPDLARTLGSETPVVSYMQLVAGPKLTALISAVLVIAIFNAIVVGVMGFGRLYYSTGRDGVWPGPVSRLLAHVHPGSHTPMAATLVVGVASALLMLVGQRTLLILTSMQTIPEYLLLAAAVLIGRKAGRTGGPFKAPLHPLAPLVTLAAAGGMICSALMDRTAGRPALLLVAALFVGSWAYFRFRANHPSAWTPAAPDSAEP